ncbi:Predicted ATPase [Nocardia farcinica]|nr:Predicted ATPase [Nocardia farcinica]
MLGLAYEFYPMETWGPYQKAERLPERLGHCRGARAPRRRVRLPSVFVPAPLADPRFEILVDAAFGAGDRTAAAGLPTPPGPGAGWLRAVALGGRGHYAAARTELARVRRTGPDPVLRALVDSTTGSLLRQLGWHAAAAEFDGRAAAAVVPHLARARHPAAPGLPDGVDAACDALTGLAADALGVGRLDLARRLLDRTAALLDTHADTATTAGTADITDRTRVRIRLHWVAAETALAAGDAARARPHAEAGLRLAQDWSSVRHRVKSRLLVAATAAAAGDRADSAARATAVAAEARAHRLLPLRWAAAMLLAGVGDSEHARAAAAAEAATCAAEIACRGGRFRPAQTC